MKDTKTLLFLSILLLFLLVSFVLLCTWGYYKFYYKNQVDKPKTQLVAKIPIAIDDDYRDSLQKIYTATINNISTSLDTTLKNADSLQFHSDLKPAEFYKLENEIATILKNNPLKADLDIAWQKIAELQNKLAELHNRNMNVEDENKRLNGKLAQLANEIKGVEQNIKTNNSENKNITKNPSSATVFTVSQLRLSAVIIKDGIEQETMQSEQTEKFLGSFIVKSNFNQSNSAEIIVVVLQPDGHVMQSSTWESGTFDTREGRKIYSSKLHFEYTNGEAKRLSFSLSADKYQKGEYVMQVYYNGMMIGKTFKTLF